MTTWTPCPETLRSRFDTDSLRRHWARLHTGDGVPLPGDPALLEGWRLYHEGAFEAAAAAGRALGATAAALTFKATCIHATYVETRDTVRFTLLLDIAEQARRHQAVAPDCVAGRYWQGYALGRYCQGISVAKALARGLGRQVREALEATLHLAPNHVDAHLALARFHAETLDQVGELIGGMLHGARKDAGMKLYEEALVLAPEVPIVLNEAADGMAMLGGDALAPRVSALLERARQIEPLDAMEKLYLQTVQAMDT